MTVKVIRRGDSIFPLEIHCPKCKSELRIDDASDLKEEGKGEYRRAFVYCPECAKQVFLYEANQLQALAEYDEWNSKKVKPHPGDTFV